MTSEVRALRCQELLHINRPDRGPAVRCSHPARYLIVYYDRLVCGHHARAYKDVVPLPKE